MFTVVPPSPYGRLLSPADSLSHRFTSNKYNRKQITFHMFAADFEGVRGACILSEFHIRREWTETPFRKTNEWIHFASRLPFVSDAPWIIRHLNVEMRSAQSTSNIHRRALPEKKLLAESTATRLKYNPFSFFLLFSFLRNPSFSFHLISSTTIESDAHRSSNSLHRAQMRFGFCPTFSLSLFLSGFSFRWTQSFCVSTTAVWCARDAPVFYRAVIIWYALFASCLPFIAW